MTHLLTGVKCIATSVAKNVSETSCGPSHKDVIDNFVWFSPIAPDAEFSDNPDLREEKRPSLVGDSHCHRTSMHPFGLIWAYLDSTLTCEWKKAQSSGRKPMPLYMMLESTRCFSGLKVTARGSGVPWSQVITANSMLLCKMSEHFILISNRVLYEKKLVVQ